jgi:tetratricopeptide (TPR) repeat protein
MSKEYSAEDYFNIARGFAITGNYDMAVTVFDEVLKMEPMNKEAWYNKGKVNENYGKIDEAINCYRQSLDIKPNFTRAMKDLGLLYYQKEKYYKSAFWLEKYIGYGNKDVQVFETIEACLGKKVIEEKMFKPSLITARVHLKM